MTTKIAATGPNYQIHSHQGNTESDVGISPCGVACRNAALAVKYRDPNLDPDETWMSRTAEILNELGRLIHDAESDAQLLILIKEWRAHLAASCWDVRDVLRKAHRDGLDAEAFNHYSSPDAMEVSFR